MKTIRSQYKPFCLWTLITAAVLLPCIAIAAPEEVGVDYDIVYVRYPAVDANDPYVTIPQGEQPYSIARGADLMLLHPDGSEEVLVDCETCSVMDPFISFDGHYVYYSRIDNIPQTPSNDSDSQTGGFIYKIDLTSAAPKPQIQLTYDDGFDCDNYAGNEAFNIEDRYTKLRDMAPFPLAGDKVGFTSNRGCIQGFGVSTQQSLIKAGAVQQLYVIDDHNGSKNTAALSNLHKLEEGTIRMAQHPMQLKDGRILFSSWQDVANKFDYAMTSLFTVDADGSNMQQFTEPHDHHKNLDHFVTQLPNEDVVWGNYYPSFDYGFGILLRAPINPEGVDYVRQQSHADSWREFDRKGEVILTPHTTPQDVPAPEIDGVASGKYSMPSAAPNGNLLTAWSSGYVNFFDAVCGSSGKCDSLKSGIYLIHNAESSVVTTPFDSTQLSKLKDDPAYNEIWPRAVVPYRAVYGVEEPNNEATPVVYEPQDNRLLEGEAAALIGTSSMLNVDSSDNEHKFNPNPKRELHDGNWTIQGAEAGRFTSDDVYAVRLIATPPIVFTDPVSNKAAIERFLKDSRRDQVAERFGAANEEDWKILGEFILPHTASNDAQGNKDTSWVAKIPADTPMLIQTLDRNGMTLTSELTWRALKAGEKRVDCGGCHVHAGEPLQYETTKSGNQAPIRGIAGLPDDHPKIQNSYFDLTQGAPLLTSTGMTFTNEKAISVEFNRDVLPVIDARCVTCHSTELASGGLILDGNGDNDAWGVLGARDKTYTLPQHNKYIRTPQARESLLVWAVYGERLDGRENSERPDDLDFISHPEVSGLTDEEKRVVARWVDLGSPVNFDITDGFGYTDDNQLPIINVAHPRRGVASASNDWVIGFADAITGVNLDSFQISYQEQLSANEFSNPISVSVSENMITDKGVLKIASQTNARKFILHVSVSDLAGNTAYDSRLVNSAYPPRPPTGLTVNINSSP